VMRSQARAAIFMGRVAARRAFSAVSLTRRSSWSQAGSSRSIILSDHSDGGVSRYAYAAALYGSPRTLIRHRRTASRRAIATIAFLPLPVFATSWR
jgi:hypothetical protein